VRSCTSSPLICPRSTDEEVSRLSALPDFVWKKRHNYLRKVAELATTFFITNDRPNVNGLVLAGSADFKTELSQSDLFDPRLGAVLLKIVDVGYGGENGFSQAIELASDTLSGVKFVQEKKLITRYFDEIAQDSGKVCFGQVDSQTALELGACETLIVYDGLDMVRVHLRNPHNSEERVLFLTPDQEKDEKLYRDESTGVELDLVDRQIYTEWLVANYKRFGTKLEFVSNKSQEGAQFIKGFGGIGGLLRYRVEFQLFEEGDGVPEEEIFI